MQVVFVGCMVNRAPPPGAECTLGFAHVPVDGVGPPTASPFGHQCAVGVLPRLIGVPSCPAHAVLVLVPVAVGAPQPCK